MFRGKFEHSLDKKGRVAIPSKYRDILLEKYQSDILVLTKYDKCLTVYPLKEWESLEYQLKTFSKFDPKRIAFERYFIASAVECHLDNNGRILIPINLREEMHIKKDCVIAGRLNKFEIWALELWNIEYQKLSDNFESMLSSMSELNINI